MLNGHPGNHPGISNLTIQGRKNSRPDVKTNRFIFIWSALATSSNLSQKECPFYHQNHHIMFSFKNQKDSMPSMLISGSHRINMFKSLSSMVAEPTALVAPGASSWHVWLLRAINFDVFIRQWRVPNIQSERVESWKISRHLFQVRWGCYK